MKKSMFVVWMLIVSCLTAAPLFVATANAYPSLTGGVESVPVLDPLSSSAAIGHLTLTGADFPNPVSGENLDIFFNFSVLTTFVPELTHGVTTFYGSASSNQVHFGSVTFDNGLFEVQNIFVNPSTMSQGAPVQGLISISGAELIPVNGPSQIVAMNGTLPTAAPEPTTMLLLGLGLVGLAGVRNKFSN